jgi:predicted anti-sigma-YlaC factor YlaD
MIARQHPALDRLDAFVAAVSGADGVAEHLVACAECRAYVDDTRAAANAFDTDAQTDAHSFIARLRNEEARRRAPAAAARRLASRGPALRKVASVIVPALAMAAAIFMLVRAPGPDSRAVLPDEPSLRFKGKVELAVIRDRDGVQERLTVEVPIRPGDRIRVEVGVAHERPILAGVLGKDGSWLPLVLPTTIEAGSYLSPKSARYDTSPSEGWILAGFPEEVERAKATRAFEGITAIPVVVDRERD